MKKTIITIVMTLAVLALTTLSESDSSADVGSCYSVRPICMYPQQPICICDQIRSNCFWACR